MKLVGDLVEDSGREIFAVGAEDDYPDRPFAHRKSFGGRNIWSAVTHVSVFDLSLCLSLSLLAWVVGTRLCGVRVLRGCRARGRGGGQREKLSGRSDSGGERADEWIKRTYRISC